MTALVQLLETPAFNFLRLHLLHPARYPALLWCARARAQGCPTLSQCAPGEDATRCSPLFSVIADLCAASQWCFAQVHYTQHVCALASKSQMTRWYISKGVINAGRLCFLTQMPKSHRPTQGAGSAQQQAPGVSDSPLRALVLARRSMYALLMLLPQSEAFKALLANHGHHSTQCKAAPNMPARAVRKSMYALLMLPPQSEAFEALLADHSHHSTINKAAPDMPARARTGTMYALLMLPPQSEAFRTLLAGRKYIWVHCALQNKPLQPLTGDVTRAQEHVRAADAAAAERGVQDAARAAAQRANRHAAQDGLAAALRVHPRGAGGPRLGRRLRGQARVRRRRPDPSLETPARSSAWLRQCMDPVTRQPPAVGDAAGLALHTALRGFSLASSYATSMRWHSRPPTPAESACLRAKDGCGLEETIPLSCKAHILASAHQGRRRLLCGAG